MTTIVIMPGGFHPFHAGHYALYQSAQRAFPDAEVFVAATNDTSARPFPFPVKEKLAKLAGVEPGHFVQVKSPFKAEEITAGFDPARDTLIFVRSEKDSTKPPQAGGVKRDGSPAYLQPLLGAKKLEPFAKHAYMAYLPTVEFGPGMTSATEIRTAWPQLNEKRKTALVMSLYPRTQGNAKLAATVVGLLDAAIGTQGVAEGGSRKAREDAKTKEINRHAGLYAYHTKQGNKAEAAKHKAELDKLHNQVNEQGGAEERWRVTVGNKSGTLSHTKVFTGTKEQAIKQAVRRFATTRDPVVRAELVDQGVAEGLEYADKLSGLVDLPVFNSATNPNPSGVAKVVNTGDRIMVVMNVRGVNVPYYISTGSGGKASVPTGKWYPVFGVHSSGWLNKGGEDSINKFYGSKMLALNANRLNNALGDLSSVEAQIPFMKKTGIAIINKDLQPMGHSEVSANPDEFKKRVNAFLAKLGSEPFYKVNSSPQQQSVAEGAPIVVALAPIDVRNPKKAPQPYRNKGDIVPDTKPPSTEKRGVKGRPGQRPMPQYDEDISRRGFLRGLGAAALTGAAGSAMAQTMPNINAQQVELANKYYNALVQRAKEDGRELDTRALNFLRAKAQEAAAQKFQQTAPSQSKPQQGFATQGSERKVAKDAGQFESQGVAEADKKCPPATQDIGINLENRQKAIDEYGYGPLNPDLPNTKFWMLKVSEWNLDSMEEAQQSLCGNCAAFDIRQDTLDCIAQGIDSDSPEDAEGVIDAGELGYCKFLKFKCASRRTCDAWVTGGPLQDKPVDENQGWAATYETNAQNFVGGMTAGYQRRENQPVAEQDLDYIEEKWSAKYKSSINCANPKGFSQKAHCAGRKK